ncbi:hypothetical protein BGX38DRAFT_1193039 [Terfezia claveryi]|nr:hypothetical protein BGX38DRAFT_1193039 [Terfezia claveryi]
MLHEASARIFARLYNLSCGSELLCLLPLWGLWNKGCLKEAFYSMSCFYFFLVSTWYSRITK